MGTIKDYLKKYGEYTFLEKGFTEVDNVVLSLLSYINFTSIVPGMKKGKITLKEASDKFYKLYNKKELQNNMISIRNASNLLKDIASTKRFGDLLLFNYVNEVTFDTQFGALCILLPTKKLYISFEGTDSSITGWKEDFMLTYMFPTEAQKKAVEYVNKVVGIFSPKVYVGGHSKGGNLALVASMYAKLIAKRKIKYVFNNDGPGLRETEYNSTEYQKLLPKLRTFIPEACIVGLLLNHDTNYMVVGSKNKGPLQHDATSWLVEDDRFKRGEISEFSKKVEKGLINWLAKMDDKQREKVVNSLFGILKKAEIDDLRQFRTAKLNSVVKIVKETKNLDKETRDMLIACFKDLLGELK